MASPITDTNEHGPRYNYCSYYESLRQCGTSQTTPSAREPRAKKEKTVQVTVFYLPSFSYLPAAESCLGRKALQL